MLNHSAELQPKLYIDHSMRMIVISWLVEVACEYELHQETLFLATALLDRFMSVAKVSFYYGYINMTKATCPATIACSL